MFALRDAMAVGSIALSTEFFSLTQGMIQVKQQIEDELRSYCVIIEPSKTPFGKTKKTYTGKMGGRNDDVSVVMQLAIAGYAFVSTIHTTPFSHLIVYARVHSVRCFYSQDRYRAFRPENRDA